VCDVISRASELNGRVVTVRGCLVTDEYEHTFLVDERECRAGALVPLYSVALSKNPMVQPKKNIRMCGRFTGQFEWNVTPLIADQRFVLNVDDVALDPLRP